MKSSLFAQRWDIRAQLLVLVAGALLPLIAFVAWNVHGQREATLAHMREEAHDQANLVRETIDGHLHFVEGVLASLAPLALRNGGSLPRAELESVMRHLPPHATNLSAYDVQGRVLTSYAPASRKVLESGIGERAYFQAALGSFGMAVSEGIVGKYSGNRIVNSALAYRDRDGRTAGVLVLTTNLAQFEERLLDPLTARQITAAVVTPDASLLMKSKGRESIDATQSPLREAIRKPEYEGEIQFGDDRRAFATVRATRAPWVVVVVADSNFIVAEGKRHSVMLIAAIIALLLGLVAALGISRRISHPFIFLHQAAEALGRGDLSHRLPALPAEAGEVARAFNAMSVRLEAQDATMRADAERFRAVFHNCPLPMGISDLQTGSIVEINAAFTEVTGRTASEVIGRTSAQIALWIDTEQHTNVLRVIDAHGRVQASECQLRLRNGQVGDFLVFAEAVEIGGRRMLLWQGVDVTARKRAEEQLLEVSKRLTLATRAGGIGIWDLELANERLVWDDTMFELFGLGPREFDGRFGDWLQRVHTEDRDEVAKCRADALAGHTDLDIRYRVLRADGSTRHFRSSATVERDERGAAVRLMGTTLDVTESVLGREALARENGELEARVAARTGELQETVRELEAFSYTVAHDLRAPLRAIDGFSSYLVQALQEPEESHAGALLAKIRRNVGSMGRLIDGLLEYARLSRQNVRGVPVDMTALATQVGAECAEAYPGLNITIDTLPDTFGDPEMLRQAWSNLIGNACKFSRSRQDPRVAIASTVGPQGTVYSVRDNGVGFDMSYSDRLFRVFERLHTDPEFGGMGVGLAVVQRVMQRHAGSVWAEGVCGEGATFYFRLPNRTATEA